MSNIPPLGQDLPIMSREAFRNWIKNGQHPPLGPHRLEKGKLNMKDLSGKDLSGWDFVDVLFDESQIFKDATLNECRFGPPRGGSLALNLDNADFSNAHLEHAYFTGVNLDYADFSNAHLEHADFTGVNLANAKMPNASVSDADLTNSNCLQVDFTGARMDGIILSGANLFQARFYRTRLDIQPNEILQYNRRKWLAWCQDHAIKERLEKERLEQAVSIFLELKENFRSIGAYGNASMAYVRERRMRRAQHNPSVARYCFPPPESLVAQVIFYIKHTILWVSDALVDLTTGYGESLFRTGLTLIVLILVIFPVLYLLAGGVVRISGAPPYPVTSAYSDLVLFSTTNILQASPNLEAATEAGKIIRLIEQFLGIMMIGLLGFVLGNKLNNK